MTEMDSCPSAVCLTSVHCMSVTSKFTCDGLTCDGCQIYFGRTWFHVRPKSMSVQSMSVRSNVFGHVRQAYIRPKSNFMSVPYCPSRVTSVCGTNLLWTDMATSVRCIFPVVMEIEHICSGVPMTLQPGPSPRCWLFLLKKPATYKC